MGRFESDLDEALVRYGQRREKIEELYEAEREASKLGEDLEPQEESSRKVSLIALGVGLVMAVAAGFALWPQVSPVFHYLAFEVEEDGNMTDLAKGMFQLIPAVAVLGAVGWFLSLVMPAIRGKDTELEASEPCDWEGGPIECQNDATILMEGRKFDLGLCPRHAEELDRQAPGDYKRSVLG